METVRKHSFHPTLFAAVEGYTCFFPYDKLLCKLDTLGAELGISGMELAWRMVQEAREQQAESLRPERAAEEGEE